MGNVAVHDGTQQDIKPLIASIVDLEYNLKRWLEQKSAEDPFTMVRRTR